MSEIIEFYRGKNILITGATGFLGGLLMEKLLRLCDVGQLYLLIRDKNGLRAVDRIQTMFNAPLFDRLRHSNPGFLSSVKLVKGDVGLPELGLSNDAKAMLVEKINIVLHNAATVKFEEPIKRATDINVRGTKNMVLLCREMKNLEAFIHVSTAFSNCTYGTILSERFYDPPVRADELIAMCESNDVDAHSTIVKVLEEWPNSYAFTKCVAENVIKTYADGVPTCIIRPAIIICTKSEPMEGWIDNYYGPTAYLATVTAGIMRITRADPEGRAEFVPADMCVNVILAACRNTALRGKNGIEIVNFSSSSQNELTYGRFRDYILEAGKNSPIDNAVWYPRLTIIKSCVLYSALSFIHHIIPAFFIDLVMMVLFKKPKALKISFKIIKFVDIMSFFACRTWNFDNDNLVALWNGMNAEDKSLFSFDMSTVDWKEMINIYQKGTRRYIFKQSDKTIAKAKTRMFWLHVMDRTLHAFVILLTANFIVGYFNRSFIL